MPPMLSNVYSDFLAVNSFLNFFDICRLGRCRGTFRSEPLSNVIASSLRFFVVVIGENAVDGAVTGGTIFETCFILSSRMTANVSAAAVLFDIEPSTMSFGTFEYSFDA